MIFAWKPHLLWTHRVSPLTDFLLCAAASWVGVGSLVVGPSSVLGAAVSGRVAATSPYELSDPTPRSTWQRVQIYLPSVQLATHKVSTRGYRTTDTDLILSQALALVQRPTRIGELGSCESMVGSWRRRAHPLHA
jgi:hypothetical protein